MEPSASSRLSPLAVRIRGYVRSSHALLGWLALLMLAFFWLAADSYPIVAYGAAALFAIASLGVIGRFVSKGPEADHALPSITVTSGQLEIANIEEDMAESLFKLAMKHRKALPPPAGIVQGLASDPTAIRIVEPGEAAKLALADSNPRAIDAGSA